MRWWWCCCCSACSNNCHQWCGRSLRCHDNVELSAESSGSHVQHNPWSERRLPVSVVWCQADQEGDCFQQGYTDIMPSLIEYLAVIWTVVSRCWLTEEKPVLCRFTWIDLVAVSCLNLHVCLCVYVCLCVCMYVCMSMCVHERACMYPSGKGPAYSGPIRWGLFIAGPLR